MHAIDPGLVVNAASGVLMIALGASVAMVRGAGRSNRAFMLFAASFGATWVYENLWGYSANHAGTSNWLIPGVLLVVASFGLLGIAHTYRQPSWRMQHHAMGIALGVALAVGLAHAIVLGPQYEAPLGDDRLSGLGYAGSHVFHGVVWGILVFLALGYRSLQRQDPQRMAGVRLMSAALVLYASFYVTRETMAALQFAGWSRTATFTGLAVVLASVGGLAALWLWNSVGSERPVHERNLAWGMIGAALVATQDLGFGQNHPGYGIARTLGVVILAFAIVRHQWLGIDVKLRWGISKSTVAAAFIAVFFIVSEAAQQVFDETTGSAYLGIAAAGALVFVLAPLQRAAERLAEKAVPTTRTDPLAEPAPSHERAYRRAVGWATRDGVLTRAEERDLLVIATRLGITPERAFDILGEMERRDPVDPREDA